MHKPSHNTYLNKRSQEYIDLLKSDGLETAEIVEQALALAVAERGLSTVTETDNKRHTLVPIILVQNARCDVTGEQIKAGERAYLKIPVGVCRTKIICWEATKR
jgi:hypothetical protein